MSDLDLLPPLRDVIRQHDLRAEKSLGQNFLLDLNLTDKVARAAGDLSGVTVLEIGPGPGGLTRSLLRAGAKKVIAVEYDPRAVEALEALKTAAEDRLEVVQADALKTDLSSLVPGSPAKIVANLPYNIATPLLIGWLKEIREAPGKYQNLALMFQKEVAERLCARPGTKSYGRLSVLAQWLCDVDMAFDIPPSAFTPPPKVTSTVVQLYPKTLPVDSPDFAKMEKVTAAAFGQRRKMIRTTLKNYAEKLEALGISGELRAENLTIDHYIALAKAQN